MLGEVSRSDLQNYDLEVAQLSYAQAQLQSLGVHRKRRIHHLYVGSLTSHTSQGIDRLEKHPSPVQGNLALLNLGCPLKYLGISLKSLVVHLAGSVHLPKFHVLPHAQKFQTNTVLVLQLRCFLHSSRY